MITSNLKFPILCFEHDFYPRIKQDWDSLTTTTKAGLKNGLFDNLLMVDSQGMGIRVKNAKKLYGVGPFWGYNIFLNQRIKVELVFEGEPFHISVDEVRKYVLMSFERWHGWVTRGDFKELVSSIHKAQSIREIIELLKG